RGACGNNPPQRDARCLSARAMGKLFAVIDAKEARAPPAGISPTPSPVTASILNSDAPQNGARGETRPSGGKAAKIFCCRVIRRTSKEGGEGPDVSDIVVACLSSHEVAH